MPIVRKGDFIEDNSWIEGDLMYARECIDVILKDLRENGQTHVNYVSEKLSVAESVCRRITTICNEDLENEK